MYKDKFLYNFMFVFIITFVLVSILAFTNSVLKEDIEFSKKIIRYKAVLNSFNISYETNEDIIENYSKIKVFSFKREDNEIVKAINEDSADITLYVYESDSKNLYAKTFSAAGLWGTITGILTFNSDLSQIINLEIIEQSETPGLGARIEEDLFREQFRGLNIVDSKVSVIKGIDRGSKERGEVAAITGATVSSYAIDTAANESIAEIKILLDKIEI